VLTRKVLILKIIIVLVRRIIISHGIFSLTLKRVRGPRLPGRGREPRARTARGFDFQLLIAYQAIQR
jgi:hypothetical protein